MTRAIGYYVHHQGAGHAARYANIAADAASPITAISELTIPGGVLLPADVVANGIDPTAGGALHWAPVGDMRSAERSMVFGRWLHEARPAGVVVDVSVEAALLCRLFGVATIVVRQHGDRTDSAHELAYRSARKLLAPFPEALEHESTPAWVRRKTTYAGFISSPRNATTMADDAGSTERPAADDIVILWGAGGGTLAHSDVVNIAAVAGSRRVWFVGAPSFDVSTLDVTPLGWVADVAAVLANRPLVIASAGNNVVADAATTGCALVVVPQARPFHEQDRHAERLDASGVAAVVAGQCDDSEWRAAMDMARRRQGALCLLGVDGDGAALAAKAIEDQFDVQN